LIAAVPMEADDVAAVSRRIEEVVPVRTGGSVFVARVRDDGGAARTLKRTSPDTGVQELAARRAGSARFVSSSVGASPGRSSPGLNVGHRDEPARHGDAWPLAHDVEHRRHVPAAVGVGRDV
jgi:hypothetical protein